MTFKYLNVKARRQGRRSGQVSRMLVGLCQGKIQELCHQVEDHPLLQHGDLRESSTRTVFDSSGSSAPSLRSKRAQSRAFIQADLKELKIYMTLKS